MPGDVTAYDLIFRDALIVDGTGAPAKQGDLAIRGDRIAAIGDAVDGPATAEIDLGGLAVAPGFIDVHTHDDRAVIDTPEMPAKVSQGVTSVVVGNCGISLSPIVLDGDPPPPMNLLGERPKFRFPRFADYGAAVDAARPAVNVAALIGHSTLRVGIMDDVRKPATNAEIAEMGALLSDALAAGAIGFSTGLFYPPNEAAGIDEVSALAARLKDSGGIYTTHMRNEHDGVLDSLEESFETGRRAEVPVVISHHKCAGPANWGRSTETLAAIEAARAGQPVGLDAYPYAAGSTVLIPRFMDPNIRIRVSWSKPHPEMAGRDLADIAADWGCSQEDAARRLDPAGAVYFQMDEADVRRILAYPHTMIGSDGLPHDSHPHPRLWGTFPRVIGHYGRDEGLFGLEEAVRRMTGLPAETFRLPGRGVLAEGRFADIVVFDPKTIADRATYDEPTLPAAGIDRVYVNGRETHHHGEATGDRAGRLLRRTADEKRQVKHGAG